MIYRFVRISDYWNIPVLFFSFFFFTVSRLNSTTPPPHNYPHNLLYNLFVFKSRILIPIEKVHIITVDYESGQWQEYCTKRLTDESGEKSTQVAINIIYGGWQKNWKTRHVLLRTRLSAVSSAIVDNYFLTSRIKRSRRLRNITSRTPAKCLRISSAARRDLSRTSSVDSYQNRDVYNFAYIFSLLFYFFFLTVFS